MSLFKNKIFRWSLLTVLVIGITGAVVAYKMYNKPHRSVEDANALTIKAADLVTAYETDENAANGKYLDKVLNVSGDITAISKNQKGETVITLKGSDMGGIICTLESPEKAATLQKDAAVSIQGICTGYLTDVVLVRCFIK